MFVILLLFINSQVYSQQVNYPCEKDSSIVKVSKITGKGKVFDENYSPDFIELPNYHSGANLTEDDILKVERLISLKFNNRFRKHWRQYLGFFDQDRNKYVFLHLEKFDEYTSELIYQNWEKTVSIVNSAWDENTSADYIIYLENDSLENYYKWLKNYR